MIPRVLVAPSGAGKSYLASKYPELFADADTLPLVRRVYEYLDTTWGKRWWERPDYAEDIRDTKNELLTRALGRSLMLGVAKQPVIMTAEGEAVEPLAAFINVAVWLPNPQLILEHQRAKRAAGNSSQPLQTASEIESTLNFYESRAEWMDARIIDTGDMSDAEQEAEIVAFAHERSYRDD